MKKFLALASVAAMVLVGCSSEKNEFKVTGENLPAELNNQMVYFLERSAPEPFDSVQITNGSFEKVFADPAADRTIFMTLGTVPLRLIPENAHIRIVPSNVETMPYDVVTDDPNSLNAQLQAFSKELHDALSPIQKEYMDAAQVNNEYMMQENPPKEELEKVQAQLEEIGKRYSSTSNAIARKYYDANKENVLGEIAFGELTFETDEEWAKAYEEAPTLIKENEQNKKHYETIQKAAETQVGKQYKDYTIEDGLGNSAKLSDYLQDGRYLVVDFWASWCGPCRKAMPHLAKLSQEKTRTVRVLSIGVWEEKIEDNEKAKQELNMTWDTLYDSKGEVTKLYGIEGIPTILLISPEGEILVRTHNPAEIDAKLAELNL